MKRTIFLLVMLLAGFVLCAADQTFAQEGTPVKVKVKSSEVVTGVVIIHVQKDDGSIDLQCNQGAGTCKTLPSGSYLMIVLPENRGMYDCKNVEMYRGDQEKPDAARKVGDYCMSE
ncbi:MAG: hypothetical protein WAK29_04655 [Terriglobales bacterium]